MSSVTKPNVKTEKKVMEKIFPQPFIKWITAVLTRMKKMWSMQDALSGIQIYADIED